LVSAGCESVAGTAASSPGKSPWRSGGPLVAAYVQKYGPKYGGFVAKEFAALPDPADHPVFLVEPEPAKR